MRGRFGFVEQELVYEEEVSSTHNLRPVAVERHQIDRSLVVALPPPPAFARLPSAWAARAGTHPRFRSVGTEVWRAVLFPTTQTSSPSPVLGHLVPVDY